MGGTAKQCCRAAAVQAAVGQQESQERRRHMHHMADLGVVLEGGEAFSWEMQGGSDAG
jgi:hypothetical protein